MQIFTKNNSSYFRDPLILIILFGLIFRISLIPSNISTSDDIYRYIWEGKLVANGINPYEFSPDDDSLSYLHSELLPAKVTFKDMPAIYPTVSQGVFALGYLISGENDKGLKLIYLLAELLTILFIVKILRLRKLNTNLVILYAWLPLPILEFFVNSHIDVVGISFFTIFIYYILKDKYLAALPFYVLATFIKFYPLILAPLLIKKLGWKKSLIFGGFFLLLAAPLVFPMIPHERATGESLFKYLSSWCFNGSVYTFFFNLFDNGYTARTYGLYGLIISVGMISLFYKDFLKAVYGVWICFIIFSATLYPWYLGWIAAVHPVFMFASVSSLIFTINISNFTPYGEVWREYWWVYLIEYLPFYLLLVYDLLKMKRAANFSFFARSKKNNGVE